MRAVLCLLLCLAAPLAAQDRASVERAFEAWLAEEVWPTAARRGVSRATYEAALGGVALDWDLPDLVPPRSAAPPPQRQAEFRAPAAYFRPDRLAADAALGREMAAAHRATLERIAAQSGVPARILLAVWGRESAFGRAPLRHDAFRVLATKGFMASRAAYFEAELIAALEVVEAGLLPREAMQASWAGALGQPQFMPSSVLRFARDGDGDGRADIQGSVADTLASIAAYLAHHGWDGARDWGFEVRLPPDLPCTLAGPDQRRAIADWEAAGVTRIGGRPFPAHERRGEASLLLPAGVHGPAFLVTPNFYVLKDYNFSDLYALHVGHLGDRIAFGMGDFRAPWRPLDPMTRGEIATFQTALQARGLDTGGADGLVGFKTRRATGLWQQARGETPTCFPVAGMRP